MWNRPEVAERLVGRLRDAAALAGDERIGDGAGLAGQGLDDAPADGLAQRARPPPVTRSAERRLGRARHQLRRGGGIADGAQPLEPGRAREIVVARQRRARRRAQRRLEADGVAGLEGGRLRHACARARGTGHSCGSCFSSAVTRMVRRWPLAGARLDQLDEAVDVDGPDLALAARARARPRCAACAAAMPERDRQQRAPSPAPPIAPRAPPQVHGQRRRHRQHGRQPSRAPRGSRK